MYKFDALNEKNNLVNQIRSWFDVNGPTCKAVIGISGGKDSTVVAALCREALGKDRVIGVLMPNGYQADIQDSCQVCSELGITSLQVNISNAFHSIINELENNYMTDGVSEQTAINLAPRLRMATLYAVAQSVNGRVMNTSNYSEYMLGYFTKFGDECGDFKPLINFTKTEVCEIGRLLPVSKELIDKVPSDGLTGKSDEDKFGFTYEALDKYLRTSICEDETIKNAIQSRIDQMAFKRKGF